MAVGAVSICYSAYLSAPPPTDIPYFVPAHNAVLGHDCLSYQDGVVADFGAMVEPIKAAGKPSNVAGEERCSTWGLNTWPRGEEPVSASLSSKRAASSDRLKPSVAAARRLLRLHSSAKLNCGRSLACDTLSHFCMQPQSWNVRTVQGGTTCVDNTSFCYCGFSVAARCCYLAG